MKKPVFALIDCNNFFVSCEKLFRPDLEGKPVVVLSSNDGCAIARSNEAKALGIPMAAPAFKYRQLFREKGVVQFSANFELYGDISRRITDLLMTITPCIEVYSIDESFLDLSQLKIDDYTAWGKMVRERIWQWIGIPVSIGIAPTKTLAKLASDRGKKDPTLAGVLNLTVQGRSLYSSLGMTAVQDVWGVGWRLGPKLKAEGVFNAWQLAQLSPRLAQQLMGVHGRQMVAELNGTSCLPLQREGKPRQSIARTRTFGEDTGDIGAIESAVASFAARAAFRLRTDRQVTRRAAIFATTNKHKPGYRSWSRQTYFSVPTADTGKLITAVTELLHEFYNPRIEYHRAGVMLWDFLPAHSLQTDLFGKVDVGKETRSQARMRTLDTINERYGRQKVHYAAEDLGANWQPRQNLRSPRYTSRWDELAKVQANIRA